MLFNAQSTEKVISGRPGEDDGITKRCAINVQVMDTPGLCDTDGEDNAIAHSQNNAGNTRRVVSPSSGASFST